MLLYTSPINILSLSKVQLPNAPVYFAYSHPDPLLLPKHLLVYSPVSPLILYHYTLHHFPLLQLLWFLGGFMHNTLQK